MMGSEAFASGAEIVGIAWSICPDDPGTLPRVQVPLTIGLGKLVGTVRKTEACLRKSEAIFVTCISVKSQVFTDTEEHGEMNK